MIRLTIAASSNSWQLPGLVLAIVLVLTITAATASAASTRAEYVTQADPICASAIKTEKSSQRGIGRLIDKSRYKAAARKFRRTNQAYGDGVEQIAALVPPPADAQFISTWVQMLRAEVPLAERAAKALAHGRIGKAIVRLTKASDTAKAYVANYGFSSCADF
jgi:hypothetical protein